MKDEARWPLGAGGVADEEGELAELAELEIARIYGPDAPAQMREFRGLLHVAAVWAGDPRWPAIEIREDSPRSPSDRFALELARARADAIVITGQLLRDEPQLRHDEPGAGTPDHRPLLAWRRLRLARRAPPWLLILTAHANFDLAHPVFASWARPIVFTTTSRAAALTGRLCDRVEIAGSGQLSLATALEHLRARGCRTISLEAGPTTLAPSYTDDASAPRIDELMLSSFHGSLQPHLRGAPFLFLIA